jgi:VWFA-related protein
MTVTRSSPRWIALLVPVASFAAAGASGPGSSALPVVDLQVEVPSVQLYPVVREGRRYVRDLTRADFIVVEDGQPVAIDSVEADVCSLSVALLIDVSDSMQDKLDRVQEASCRFVDRLGAEDRVAVWAFSHLLYHVAAPTADHEAAKDAIRRLRTGGGTAIYDSLAYVVEHGFSPLDRNVVVLFSDGRDGTRAMPTRTARLARERGVIVYTLHIPESTSDLEALRGLRVLTEWTGGESQVVPRMEKLDRLFDAILDDLRAQYRLTFTPPPGPPGERKVEVKTTNPRHSVRCRERYRYDG